MAEPYEQKAPLEGGPPAANTAQVTGEASEKAAAVQPVASEEEIQRLGARVKEYEALLEQYESDLCLIDQISQTLGVSVAQPGQLYQSIYEQIRASLPMDTFGIVLAQPGDTSGHFAIWMDDEVQYKPHDEPLGPLLKWIVENAEPLIFDDVYQETEERFQALPLSYGQQEKRAYSWLSVPMMVRGQVRGVMTVQAYEPGLYGSRERRLLGVIANQSAVAIENARLFRRVRQMLHELAGQVSTPIVPVHEGVLVLPLVGAVNARRASQVIEVMLTGIEEHDARVVIVDITGVPAVDTQIAHSLLQAARAAHLLGTQVVLTGIRPEVAETIVTLGVDLSELETRSSLQAGIEYALQTNSLGGVAHRSSEHQRRSSERRGQEQVL